MLGFVIINLYHFNNLIYLFDDGIDDPIFDIGGKEHLGNTVSFHGIDIDPFNIDLSFGQ